VSRQEQERVPGYAGMIAAGTDPREAWEQIRAELAASPETRAVIAALAEDEEGRAALAYSRERWAVHGFPPPWEDAGPQAAGGEERA
jgi:hypothetical protein